MSAHVIDLARPLLPLGRVVDLHIALNCRDHADHGLLCNLQIASNTAVRALERGGDVDQILTAEQQAGVLWSAQALCRR